MHFLCREGGGDARQKVQDCYSSTHKMLLTPRSEVLLELYFTFSLQLATYQMINT